EQLDVLRHRRLIEARPPRPGLELGVRAKQLRAAAGAAIGAVVLEVDVLPGEGALGGGMAQDLELIGAQSFAPLLLGEAHVSVCVHGFDASGPPGNVAPEMAAPDDRHAVSSDLDVPK